MYGRIALRQAVAVALVCAALGCSKTSKKYPVKGVVKLDGAPVAGATVTFLPDGEKGQPASGMTDSQGNFTLSTNNVDGAMAGNYKVTISKTKAAEQAGGSSGPPQGGGQNMAKGYLAMMAKRGGTGKQGGGFTGSGAPKNELPAQYAEATTSALTCKVPIDEPITFNLHK